MSCWFKYGCASLLAVILAGQLAFGESAQGLVATYYDNKNFTGKSLTQVDPTINFNWGMGAPMTGFGVDTFSVVWQGQLIAPSDGQYTIATTSDDGVEVWIGRTLVIYNMANHSLTRNTGKVFLKAGQAYEMTVRYFDNTGTAQLNLLWQYGANPEEIIPQSNLKAVLANPDATLPPATGAGLQATYFENEDFTGPSVTRFENAINYNWGSAAPMPGIGEIAPWSAIWAGQLQAPLTDTYTITTHSTGCLLVYLDGNLIIDRSTRHTDLISSVSVPLTGGKSYKLVVKFSTFGKLANLNLWWSNGNMAPQLVPGNRVAPPVPDTTPLTVNGDQFSRVNPAWITGTVNAATTYLFATANSKSISVVRDNKNTWYVNASGPGQPMGLPLVAGQPSAIAVSADGETQTVSIQWEVTDLNRTYGIDPTIIRVGDSLLLTNTAEGANFEIDTKFNSLVGFVPTLSGVIGQQIPVRFTEAGTFTLQSRVDGRLVGKMLLHVVSADLLGPIACEINYQRAKDINVSRANTVTLTSNDNELMLVKVLSPITGGQRLSLKPLMSGKPVVAARIHGERGPIVASIEVDEFTMRTTAERVIPIDETFPDGSMLGTAKLIQTPLIPQLDVTMKAFVSGVLFTNGTNQWKCNTSEFVADPLSKIDAGFYRYQIIRNADVKHGFCHNFVVFQNGVQVSY